MLPRALLAGLSSPIAKLLAVGVLATAVWIATKDWASAREARRALEACAAAAASPVRPLEGCPVRLAAAIETARRAAACDVAVEAGDLYAERMSCSAPVKRRGAELAAIGAEVASLREQLASADARARAAIARAEARSSLTMERTIHAKAAIAAAPRGDDGLSDCSGECLRRLAGEAGPGR